MALRVNPYIKTNGNAREVIEYYKQALGASVVHTQTYGEMMETPSSEWRDLISYAIIRIGESDVYISDLLGATVSSGDQLTLSVATDDVNEAKRIFQELQKDGEVIAPLEETPFSPAFGTVKDKYGIVFTVLAE